MIYRLESRGAVRRVEKIRNFHIFQASVDRDTAEKQVVAELLRLFDGRVWPILEHLIRMGRLATADLKDVEQSLKIVAQRRAVPGVVP